MLSTHYRKDAQLIAATIDNDTEKVKKRIYFLAPDESTSSSDSGSSDDDDSDDEYFRPPMAKRRRRSKHAVDDDTVYKCKSNEHIVPYYNPKERVTMFIAGAQNCGKSYFVAQFLKTYKLMHPKRPIYLFTGLTEKDKHFEKFNIRQVIMDSANVDEIDLEKLRVDDKTDKRRGCLLIFDDTDRIRDKGLMQKVYKLLDDALANGRDHESQKGDADIDILVTNHEINDYQRTRGILTNCNYVVLFPFYSLATQMNLIMDKIGISKDTQKKILQYKGRAVVIRKIAPLYCVMNRKVFLLRK